VRIADVTVIAAGRVLVVAAVERQRDRDELVRREADGDVADAAVELVIGAEKATALAEATEHRDLDRALRERHRGGCMQAAGHRTVADRQRRCGLVGFSGTRRDIRGLRGGYRRRDHRDQDSCESPPATH
jgi:hypothetical protein